MNRGNPTAYATWLLCSVTLGHFLIVYVLSRMPQLVPFYFVNQLSFAFLIMAILIYIFSNYLLPLYPQLFLTRLAITKLSQKSPLFIRGWVFYFQNIGRFNPKIGATTTATATTITAQIQVRHYRVGIYPLSHLRLVLDWVGSRCGGAVRHSHCHTQTRPTRRPPHDSRGCMGGAFQPHTQEVGVCKATLYYCKSGTNECFKIGIYLKKPE
jgi:F-type H+-transporting ATPase subunit 8